MIFTNAYIILSKAVEDTVGSTDTGILYLMSRTAYSLQNLVTDLNKAWLTETGNNPNEPNVITLMYKGVLTKVTISNTMTPDEIKLILDNPKQVKDQLSQGAIQEIQASIAIAPYGSGSDGNQIRSMVSGEANTLYSNLGAEKDFETADPSSESQQVTSNMNSFSGNPAADIAMVDIGFGIWNTAGSLTQQGF